MSMSEPTTLSSSPQALVLYTDGACRGNPGPGGWAALLSTDDQVRWYAGRDGRTTNNRMEILAAIKGLEQTPSGRQVTIVSDSQYLVNTMTKGWQRKKNHDLWGQLDALVKGRSVTWEWIYGHAGHPFNEEADRLARAAAKDSQWGERSGVLMANMSSAQVDDAPSQPETESPRLSHLDEQGRARMVDVSPKDETERAAVAKGAIHMQPETLALILSGGIAKGDVFTVAQVAGIMAAKKTSDLIPMCHPLQLTHVSLEFHPDQSRSCVEVTATVRTRGVTGVEMEALTAASVAALTIYDMCKAADRAMRVTDIRLTHKSGGKSGDFQQD